MKKKNLDAYVSFVQSMHISTASRRNMMQMLLDESAELPEPAVTRRRDPAAAWLRFERISGIAAVLIVGISAALLIHSAVRSAPIVATTLESALAGSAGIPANRTSAAAPAISLLMNLFFMLTTSLSTLFILLFSLEAVRICSSLQPVWQRPSGPILL